MRDRVQNALYRAFVTERRHQIKVAAPLMGISKSALQKYVGGDLQFPARLLGPLYAATKDAELVAELIGASSSGLVVSEVEPEGVRDARAAMADVVRLGCEYADALRDGKIDDTEWESIARMWRHVRRLGSSVLRWRDTDTPQMQLIRGPE